MIKKLSTRANDIGRAVIVPSSNDSEGFSGLFGNAMHNGFGFGFGFHNTGMLVVENIRRQLGLADWR